MADSNLDHKDRSDRTARADSIDPFTQAQRHFDSMFNTLWTLPAAIYQRGNEHGRAFNKVYNERRGEREDKEEMEDRREDSACGWRGRRDKRVKEDMVDTVPVGSVTDDWVGKIIRELEKGEQQAKQVYESFWGEDGCLGSSLKGDRVEERRGPTKEEGKLQSNWSEVSPAWTNESRQKSHTTPHDHVFGCHSEDNAKSPLSSSAKDVEDTIDRLHSDFGRMLGDVEPWRRRIYQGYERDSRLWDEEGHHSSSVPFSRPLSTLFSLGMRPFLPPDSAMGYILYSEYSPLHLEREEGFDTTWRERFEDLLKAQDGQMLAYPASKSMTKIEWAGRIIPLLKDRGPKQEPTTDATSADHDAEPEVVGVPITNQRVLEGGPQTELDVYERHFGDPPRANVEYLASDEPSGEVKLSMLSTITTTERRVAPDGLVTVKTILKKRFADGTEESTETTESSRGQHAISWPQTQQDTQPEKASNIVQEAKRGSGWFWRN